MSLLRRITDFILQGRIPAMGTAFVCAFIPIVGTISILIAGLVTLRKGVQEGALVLVAATLPILISYASFPADSSGNYTVSPTDAVTIVLGINVLTWLYAVTLRSFPSWSLVLQVAGVASVAIVVTVHIVYPDVGIWWQNWLTNYFNNSTGQLSDPDMKTNADMVNKIIAGIAPYATGVVAMSISFYALLELLLARWWQAAVFNPGGLRKELLMVRMSYAAGFVLLAGMVLSYWGNDLVIDVMPSIYLVFGLAGLSLLHYIVKATKASWFWLALLYVGLAIVPTAIILVAMLALLDTGLDFRKRLTTQI